MFCRFSEVFLGADCANVQLTRALIWDLAGYSLWVCIGIIGGLLDIPFGCICGWIFFIFVVGCMHVEVT